MRRNLTRIIDGLFWADCRFLPVKFKDLRRPQFRITKEYSKVSREIDWTRTSCINFLPKIHKPNNLGRPIVLACSCPTEVISSGLDKIMAPIVKTFGHHISKTANTLFKIFRDFNFLGQDKLIFTVDITSLYTVIPNGEGLLGPLNIFLINALLRNLNLKHYFA